MADERSTGTARVKRGLAEMLRGGVIMDVVTAEQAKIAEDAGACAVMALERVPADIRAQGGVARMASTRKIGQADAPELFEWAKQLQAPLPLVQEVAETGWLPVPLFCAGGIATPADAALAMQLGAEAVFVGSGIFKSDEPSRRAKAIVEATTHFRDPHILAKVSRGLGAPMTGIAMDEINQRYAERGW